MEYQFIEFTKELITSLNNRNYHCLNKKIANSFNQIFENINNNVIDFLKDPIIECLINTYHDLKDDGKIVGENRKERINYFFSIILQSNYINHFFEEYNVLYSLIGLRLDNISKLYLHVIESLLKDKEEIASVYGFNIETISSISLPKGDIHDGKAVVVIDFSGGKLVFKPREMAQEKLIYDAIKIIESKGPKRIKYKIPFILSKQNYSWQEFISHKECETMSQVHNFYYKIGSFLALFYLFNTNDLHFDNMIAYSEDPVFFDIETLTLCYAKLKDNVENLKLPFDVTNTIILPLKNTEGLFDVGLSAIFTEDNPSKKMSNLLLKEDESDDWVYESTSVKMSIGKNICKLRGKEVSPWQVEDDIILGFKDTYGIIRENKELFLILLENSGDFPVRQLLRPTYVYGKFINASGTPDILKSYEKYNNVFSILSKNFSRGKFGFLRVEAETDELKKWNIPSFYCGFKNDNLFLNERLICKKYFEFSPYEIVKNNLDDFSDKKMLQQLRLIHLSLLTLGEREKSKIQKYENLTKISFDKNSMEDTVGRYVNKISEYFISLNNKGKVLQFPYIVKDGFGFQLCKNEFYQYGGIVLLLIVYSKFVDKQKKEIAKDCLDYLIESYLDRVDLKTSNIEYSFYYGISSLLYLTYIYSKLFNDKKYYNYSKRIYHDITNYYLNENSISLDYLSGFPSVIQLLINIKNDCNDIVEDNEVLNLLIEKYVKFVKEIDLSIYDNTLTHGLPGILSSLGLIYSEGHDKKVKEILLKYIPVLQENCKSSNSIYWCKGLTGMLVVDNILRKSTNGEIFIFENPESILSTIISSLVDNDQNLCLCHGINGVLMCLESLIDDENFKEKVESVKKNIMFELNEISWFNNSKADYDSFMDGSAGVAYSYLSYFYKIPNPLLLEV